MTEPVGQWQGIVWGEDNGQLGVETRAGQFGRILVAAATAVVLSPFFWPNVLPAPPWTELLAGAPGDPPQIRESAGREVDKMFPSGHSILTAPGSGQDWAVREPETTVMIQAGPFCTRDL